LEASPVLPIPLIWQGLHASVLNGSVIHAPLMSLSSSYYVRVLRKEGIGAPDNVLLPTMHSSNHNYFQLFHEALLILDIFIPIISNLQDTNYCCKCVFEQHISLLP
jgi:hypothetical protein